MVNESGHDVIDDSCTLYGRRRFVIQCSTMKRTLTMSGYNITRNDDKERLLRKHEALSGKKALYEEWEKAGKEPDDPYMRRLREQIHKLEVQLKEMSL